jgi:sirohydrochlorin cobaltochelatase
MEVHMNRKLLVALVTLVFVFSGFAVSLAGSPQGKAGDDGKKGILVVSFGTSYAGTRELTIDAIEKKIANEFPDYEVRRAFTSHIIIDIYKERDDIDIDTPEQALQKMAKEGFSEVVVQSTHLINGAEFHDLVVTVNKFKEDIPDLKLGWPILSTTDDYYMAIDALKDQLPRLSASHAVVLMGHGTHHPANSTYAAMQMMLLMEGLNVFMGTVEGYPTLDEVMVLLERFNIREVTLMPYMFVAGDHASNDMAGDEEDSWKTILTAAGYKVNIYLHGLGENRGYQDIVVMHAKQAIEGHEHEEHE